MDYLTLMVGSFGIHSLNTSGGSGLYVCVTVVCCYQINGAFACLSVRLYGAEEANHSGQTER